MSRSAWICPPSPHLFDKVNGKKVHYKMFRGGSADFEAGGKEGEALIRKAEGFLGGLHA